MVTYLNAFEFIRNCELDIETQIEEGRFKLDLHFEFDLPDWAKKLIKDSS